MPAVTKRSNKVISEPSAEARAVIRGLPEKMLALQGKRLDPVGCGTTLALYVELSP
jgi:hypothetical protein